MPATEALDAPLGAVVTVELPEVEFLRELFPEVSWLSETVRLALVRVGNAGSEAGFFWHSALAVSHTSHT